MEPIKLFFDTNVVIDFFTGRQGNDIAERTLQCCESGLYRACVSVLTGVNTLYITRKFSRKVSMQTIGEFFEILPVTASQWVSAQGIDIVDPEDAVQLACALENGCRVLITRDQHLLSLRDPGLRILSPESFLELFAIFD